LSNERNIFPSKYASLTHRKQLNLDNISTLFFTYFFKEMRGLNVAEQAEEITRWAAQTVVQVKYA